MVVLDLAQAKGLKGQALKSSKKHDVYGSTVFYRGQFLSQLSEQPLSKDCPGDQN